jgi:hypothetical protein
MSSTTLNVTVNGGTAPLSIHVIFYKDGNLVSSFSKTQSFSFLIDGLVLGSIYDITIAGFNPTGGYTTLSLSTESVQVTADSDLNPCKRTGISYFVDFNFTV